MSHDPPPSAVETDDGALVVAAQAGDRRALNTLLSRHHGRIAAVCRRITGDRDDAADATQEALISIVRGLPRFDGRSAFTTWSYRIAVNASLDELRRRRRRPDPVHIAEPSDNDDPRSTRVVADAVADEALRSAELRLDLDRALRAVPSDFRAALVLRDVCGLDYAEIGQVLGLPGGTVRSRIARGRVALAQQLGPADPAARRGDTVLPTAEFSVQPSAIIGGAEPGRRGEASNPSTTPVASSNES